MRPSKDEMFMVVAAALAARSTCLRRAVGCVLVDARGHVLSTGYNGTAAGLPHCNEAVLAGADFEDRGGGVAVPRRMAETFPHACSGAGAASGTMLDACEAIHAESNALLQCRDVWKIDTCYVTTSPCVSCTKMLMNTSCRRIAFAEEYAHGADARALWLKSPERSWEMLKSGPKSDVVTSK